MEPIAAVHAVARRLGLPSDAATVCSDAANVVVDLPSAGVVARVPTLTASVRPDTAERAAREVALVGRLAARGAPVAGPADAVDPGPHADGGYAVTLWRRLHATGGAVDVAEAAASLADLHRHLDALAAGDDPPAAVGGPATVLVDDIDRMIDRAVASGAMAGGDAVGRLRAEADDLRARLAAHPEPVVLHGDPHPGNVLATADGPVWIDFEDGVHGPRAWDVACLAHASAEAHDAVLAALPRVDPSDLDVASRLRDLQAVAWTHVLAEERPDVRIRAARFLEDWLADRG